MRRPISSAGVTSRETQSMTVCEVEALVLVGGEDPVITSTLCEQSFHRRYADLEIAAEGLR